MAQYRQSGHSYSSNGAPDHTSVGIRAPSSSHVNHIQQQQQQKPGRFRRSGRSERGRLGSPIGAVIVVLCFVLFVTLLAYYYLSTENRRDENHVEDDEMKNDLDFLANVTRTETFKVFGFGRGGSAVHGRDSRYWDRDDRRRDEDYNEDDVDHLSKVDRDESSKRGHNRVKVKSGVESSQDGQRGFRLYNEDGLKELKKYEAEYEASAHNSGGSRKENGIEDRVIDNENPGVQSEAWDSDNEYDDGIGSHDSRPDKFHDSEPDKVEHSDMQTLHDGDDDDSSVSSNFPFAKSKDQIKGAGSFSSQNSGIVDSDSKHSHAIGSHSSGKLKLESRRKSSRRKFSGSSCEMKFLNSTTQIVEPIENRKFVRFSLQYIEMEKPDAQEEWKPRFAGHQSLQEREESFLAHDQKIHCGFVRGPEGTPSTGFDLAEDDVNFISRCHIAVISCIFGNSDRLRSPVGKTVTRLSRKNVCFVMFVDEVTFQTLSSDGQMPDREGFIGLWKIVVVKNLPYEDMRRVGKIPKLLPHRLFPSARYSIWLDSKLRLQRDPLIILEYFLWRKGHEYAISNHYDRHCVWEEVAQNKRLNKYNHTVIDQQFSFYQADGLKRFNASDPKKLLPSNVPEGSLILRAHTPMSNLFSCLWFNEVDRFTSRDQLSFGYTYQKLRRMNPGKSFRLNMFKDCERRAIGKLFRHRSEEKRANLRQAIE